MILEHYPYRFVKKDKEPWDGLQFFLMHRLLGAYILINRKELEANPGLLDDIVNGFTELYPYFE